MKRILEKVIKKNIIVILLIIAIFSFSIITIQSNEKSTVATNSGEVSNKKVEWGIKRSDGHKQPDLGATNKKILDEVSGIAMGNKESNKVYLTFDQGYEAGYTEKILEVLKQNEIKATFFLTAHYINTKSDLVQRMLNEGHSIGNHRVSNLMSLN